MLTSQYTHSSSSTTRNSGSASIKSYSNSLLLSSRAKRLLIFVLIAAASTLFILSLSGRSPPILSASVPHSALLSTPTSTSPSSSPSFVVSSSIIKNDDTAPIAAVDYANQMGELLGSESVSPAGRVLSQGPPDPILGGGSVNSAPQVVGGRPVLAADPVSSWQQPAQPNTPPPFIPQQQQQQFQQQPPAVVYVGQPGTIPARQQQTYAYAAPAAPQTVVPAPPAYHTYNPNAPVPAPAPANYYATPASQQQRQQQQQQQQPIYYPPVAQPSPPQAPLYYPQQPVYQPQPTYVPTPLYSSEPAAPVDLFVPPSDGGAVYVSTPLPTGVPGVLEVPIVIPPLYEPAEDHKVFRLEDHGGMDLVYTYVNRSFTRGLERFFQGEVKNDSGISPDSVLPHMYRDRGELCFSLRSIDRFFPDFKGRVHIVTNTPPAWLNTANPRVHLVPEADILPPENLPTFNSMALEANLHLIPGLADYYLYLNDDFMLGRKVSFADFVSPASGCHMFYHLPLDIDGKSGRKNRLKHPHGHALLNAHKLIDSVAPDGVRFPRYDLAHIPHFFHRSLATHVFNQFSSDLIQQSTHRFRSTKDIHFAHLYSYYTREIPINASNHATGRCAEMRVVLPVCRPGYDYCFGVKPNATDIARELRALRERSPQLPKFLNLNDKNPTADGARQAQRVTTDFLRKLFPKPSQFESYDCMEHYELPPLDTDPSIESFLILSPEAKAIEAEKLAKKKAELQKDVEESLQWRDREAEIEAMKKKELGLPEGPELPSVGGAGGAAPLGIDDRPLVYIRPSQKSSGYPGRQVYLRPGPVLADGEVDPDARGRVRVGTTPDGRPLYRHEPEKTGTFVPVRTAKKRILSEAGKPPVQPPSTSNLYALPPRKRK